MRAFLARLRDAFRRRAIAEDFAAESAFHLEELEREAIARGESPEEARASAIRAFGNVTQSRETLRAQAGFPQWDEFLDDLRYATRGLLRRPMLSLSVVLILTLGLGAAATVCDLMDVVFLRPLPVAHPEQLYAIVNADGKHNDRLSRGTVQRLEQYLPPGSVAAYHGGAQCTVQVGAEPATRVGARAVNGDFFATLGLVPAAGRLLSPADDRISAPANVVVVSYAWAVANFGNPQAALGREVLVNRVTLAVVGVLPPRFRDIALGQKTDLWLPAALQYRLQLDGNSSSFDGDDRPNNPDWNREERVSWLEVLVRSRPHAPVSLAIVQRAWEAQRDDIARGTTDAHDRDLLMHRSWALEAAPGGHSGFRRTFQSTAWLLGGIVTVLLVLVCTNVSGLLLVRSMSRHREIGVRLALGAGPFRVVRFSIFEALLLTGVGALGGYVVALVLLPIAARLFGVGPGVAVTLGFRSLAAMAGLALVAAFCSAVGPAVWISRVEPLRALSGNHGIGRAPIRFGRMLVVAQFALAVALVALAVALGDSVQRSLAADAGFDRDHVVTAAFDPTSAGYRSGQVLPLVNRLRDTALGVPGVKQVSFAFNGILAGSRWQSGINFRNPKFAGEQRVTQEDSVLPGYFATAGTPLLMGRDFAATDGPGAQPVAIVSASLAHQVFGDANPIGEVFGYDRKPSREDWTIVGVVGDVHVNGIRESAPPMFYLSALQADGASLHFVVIRFEGAEAAVLPAVRAAFARAEPGLVFTNWKTLRQRMLDDVGRDVATSRLTWLFGGCALVLAAFGVAGSLGHLVTLRQREIALRMAVGADAARLLRGVIGDALRLCAWGSIAGIGIIWALPFVPLVKATLMGPPNVSAGVIAAALALLTAVVGGWIPARRAARIDPMLTLKCQ